MPSTEMDISKFIAATNFIGAHGIDAFNNMPTENRHQMLNESSRTSRCWCDSNHAYPSLCPSMPWPNHVGRHRLTPNWSWDRSMRFRVNLKGGAFGA